MKRILFVGEGTVSDDVRCKLPAVELSKRGYEVAYLQLAYRDNTPSPQADFDCVIFSRPHHTDLVTAYKRLGIPVIVDMDDDFHSIPETHPGYKHVGKGDLIYLMKLENCLYLADLLTITTNELKSRLSQFNQNTMLIPNGWSSGNFNWLVKRSRYRDNFIFGWAGTITHRADFQQVVAPMRAILKKHKNTMIMIGGDPEIYNIFANTPQDQKLFIPQVSYDNWPTMLAHMDVMLVPLLDDEFNRAKSDIKLVDSGAKGIPFIASNMPVYQDWPGGGVLVYENEWFTAMDRMVSEPDYRKELSLEGRRLAQNRDMLVLVDKWVQAVEHVIHEKNIEIGVPE